jgi:hypothetical protein
MLHMTLKRPRLDMIIGTYIYFKYVYVCIYLQIYNFAYLYVCICMYLFSYTYTYTYIRTFIYTYVYIYRPQLFPQSMAAKRPLSEINIEKKSHKKMPINNVTSSSHKISQNKINSPQGGVDTSIEKNVKWGGDDGLIFEGLTLRVVPFGENLGEDLSSGV